MVEVTTHSDAEKGKSKLNTTFRHLSKIEFNNLTKGSTVLSEDQFGAKVYLLQNGFILKLFRIKRLLSSARIIPYASRFHKNSVKLLGMGISTVSVRNAFNIPHIHRTAVLYRAVEGVTFREFLKKNLPTDAPIQKVAKFLAKLHRLGVYFRSIHFGNIIMKPDGNLSLIDISDLRVKRNGLKFNSRIRNFRHFTRYEVDRILLRPGAGLFVDIYSKLSAFPTYQYRRFVKYFYDMLKSEQSNNSGHAMPKMNYRHRRQTQAVSIQLNNPVSETPVSGPVYSRICLDSRTSRTSSRDKSISARSTKR